MEFTPQQMGGYKGYSPGVLVGNWSEELAVRDDKMRRYQSTMAATRRAMGLSSSGGMAEDSSTKGGSSGSAMMGSVDPKLLLMQRVTLGPSSPERFLQFGVPMMIKCEANGGCVALDTTPRHRPALNHALVTCVADDTPMVRSSWVLHKAKDGNADFYEAEGEANIVHYGQYVRIVNEYASPEGYYSLSSRLKGASSQTRGSKRQEVTACLGATNDCLFVIEQSDGKALTCPLDGHPVRAGDRVVLRHKVTNVPLVSEPEFRAVTAFGAEYELAAHLVKPQHTNTSAITQAGNFFTFVAGAPGGRFVPFNAGAVQSAIERVRAKILSRGVGSYASLQRTFKTLDADSNRMLSRRELKDGMEVYGVPLTTAELDSVFKAFDADGSGGISLTEFLMAIRGQMSERREGLVFEAFRRLDTDGSGVASFEELRAIYGANLADHPEVRSGFKTEAQVMRDFVAMWDGDGDGNVTIREFANYYNGVSAGIDDDDYFELMIRNAWRIDGGEGKCANTANRRVLVTFDDGKQRVVGLTNDLGVGTDMGKIQAALKAQGITGIKRVDLK